MYIHLLLSAALISLVYISFFMHRIVCTMDKIHGSLDGLRSSMDRVLLDAQPISSERALVRNDTLKTVPRPNRLPYNKEKYRRE